jgi:hypothetical protein
MAITERELIAGYAGSRRTPTDHALALAVAERVRELRGYVRWYNALEPTRRWTWRDIESDHRRELAGLLRLVRRARQVEADPVIRGGYGRWSEPELREAYGR